MSDLTERDIPRGVIVEFDFTVLPGHQLLLDVCKEQLAAAGLEVDATLIARYMFGKPFTHALEALAASQGKTLEDAPGLIAACNTAFSTALTTALTEAPADFVKFAKAITAKGVKLIVISRANADAVKALFATVQENLTVQTDTSSGFGFLGWDVWRRAARKNNLRERLCVAITGSGFSVKGVLTSSMGGTLFKVNPLVAYQDFSGGDNAIQKFDASVVNDVTRILRI